MSYQQPSRLKFFRFSLVFLVLIISYLAFTPLHQETGIMSGFDKANHLLAFFVLALFSHFSFIDKPHYKVIIFPLLGYAFFIELVQYFLPFRSFSVFDIVADLCGIILYIILHKQLLKTSRWSKLL
ncbi:MAG: VanZ family protein [Pseudomonadota bacterium]